VQLFINNEKVDFTLESEKTLADVIGSLEQWLAQQKLVIVGLEIDHTPYHQTDLEDKKNTPLSAIQVLKVVASDFVVLEMDGVRDLNGFFLSLEREVVGKDEKALAATLAKYQAAAGTMRFILTGTEHPGADEKRAELDKLLSGTTAGMIRLWDKRTREQALDLCRFFLAQLQKKTTGYDELKRTSRKITDDTIAKLRSATERLKGVPILLQTGKDGEAMQSIASFTELAQLFLQVIADQLAPPESHRLKIDGVDLREYSAALNTHLRDLVEAFEKKDYILIGDLCEYEIAPKIIALIDSVEQSLPA
jgi:hypothetical protein